MEGLKIYAVARVSKDSGKTTDVLGTMYTSESSANSAALFQARMEEQPDKYCYMVYEYTLKN